MPWKKNLLKKANLYLILDREVNSYEQLLELARASIPCGIDIIQLHDKAGLPKDILKFAGKMQKLLNRRIPFIMNDRIDLALASGACGVHLGQEDVPVKIARQLMGPRAIIGASCQTLGQAQAAQAFGADYIGFGSVFKTPTKPQRQPMNLHRLAEVIHKVKIPVFAIGGISKDNVVVLREHGVQRVAVCRAISKAKNIQEATRVLSCALYTPQGHKL